MRFPLALSLRLLVGFFLLGSVALRALLPLPPAGLLAAVSLLGLAVLLLPSYAACDARGVSLRLLGLPAGAVAWQRIAALRIARGGLAGTSVRIEGRGVAGFRIPAGIDGLSLLLGEIARRRPDILDASARASLKFPHRGALRRLAPPLLLAEVAAFLFLASRLA